MYKIPSAHPWGSKNSWRLHSVVSAGLGSLHKKKNQLGAASPTIFIATCFGNISSSISSKLKILSINSRWLKESFDRVATWQHFVKKKKKKFQISRELSLGSNATAVKTLQSWYTGGRIYPTVAEPEATISSQLLSSNPLLLRIQKSLAITQK